MCFILWYRPPKLQSTIPKICGCSKNQTNTDGKKLIITFMARGLEFCILLSLILDLLAASVCSFPGLGATSRYKIVAKYDWVANLESEKCRELNCKFTGYFVLQHFLPASDLTSHLGNPGQRAGAWGMTYWQPKQINTWDVRINE